MPALLSRLVASVSALALALAPLSASANPLNGQVVGGSASIAGQGTPNVIIDQSTNRAVIDWRSFNIAPNETTQFIQPNASSVTLNRVTGNLGASQINGIINGNGGVYVVNPDGILIGRSASVNVGSFLATTHDISNLDFMAGSGKFTIPGNPSASIVNQGTITAATGGFAALVAPGVRNDGVISARLGTVALASGNAFTLDLYGDNLITLQPGDAVAANVVDVATGQTLKSLVQNTGKLKANGGTVSLTAVAAKQVIDSVINSTGVVEANSIGARNGLIVFGAATAATKPAGAPTQTVKVAGRISAAGRKAGATGGKIQIAGENIRLSGAKLNASGGAGGGTVLIGGVGHSGAGPALPVASEVTVDAATTIDVSATGKGNGGAVVLWSGGLTTSAAAIAARGGAEGGDGGFVETSGSTVDFTGIHVDTSAPAGKAGTWLVDPTDLTVDGAAASTIATNLGTTNVTLQTNADGTTSGPGNTSSGPGDIIITAPISWASANSLTLSAYHDVAVDADITNSSGANVILRADNSGSGAGTVTFGNSDVVSTSGAVSIFYNPPGNDNTTVNAQSYTTPTNYSGDVTGGAQLTAYMLVNTVYDLQNVQNNLAGDYALGANIDASATAGWNGGAGFVPIGNTAYFTGIFSGQGNTISNLTINPPANSHDVGLFGNVDSGGAISNVGLIGGSVTGASYVGGLVGLNYGLVTLSYAADAVTGGTFVGGLVGGNDGVVTLANAAGAVKAVQTAGGLVGINNGSISQSYATGAASVSGPSYVGGLVGQNYGSVALSYATGAVGSSSASGGLIGWNSGSVTQSFATGAVSSGNDSAGLIGVNYAGGAVSSSYWDTTTTGQTNGAASNSGTFAATGLTTSQFATASNFPAFSFGASPNAAGCAAGTAACWVIVDGDGSLDNASGAAGATRPMLLSEYSTTIVNAHQLQLMELNPAATYTLANNVNLGPALANPSDVWGPNGSAGFVPIGNLDTPFNGAFNGAGNTIANLTINLPSSDYVGLFGNVGDIGLVENVGVVGGSVTGNFEVGGLAGDIYTNPGMIKNSFATDSVTGNTFVGGLVGGSSGTVTQSYATGAVTGKSGSSYVGGLVGANGGGTVIQSYSIGLVTAGSGSSAVGGLIGGNGGTVTSSYWDTQSSGQTVSDGGTGLTTAQFQAGLPSGFDATVWGSNAGINNGYPFLLSQNSTGMLVVDGYVYSDAGVTVVGSGVTVSGLVNGAPLGAVTTGANGSYNFLLSPGAISASGSQVLTYTTGPDAGVAYQQNATGSVYNLNIYPGYLNETTGVSALSAVAPGLSTAIGGNSAVQAIVNGLGSRGIVATGPSFNIDQTINTGSLWLSSSGLVNQSAPIVASSLALLGAGGSYALNNIGNQIGTLAANTGSVDIASSTGLNIGAIAGANGVTTTGATTLNVIGSITAPSAVDVGAFTLAGGNWVQVGSPLPGFAAHDFSITGGSFLRALGGNGSTESPYQITDLYGLQGIGSSPGLLSDNYVLANNIDATGTANWNGGAGFVPIGSAFSAFNGELDGAGNTISGLTINMPSAAYVGLFGSVGAGATVENLGVVGGSVSGGYLALGALAGLNEGTVTNDYATTAMSGAGNSTGGLVGENGGAISQSHATGAVSVGSSNAGGLAGGNDVSGSITLSYATGAVSGGADDGYVKIGGLVGSNAGAISQSDATGAVTGYAAAVGGLVGYNTNCCDENGNPIAGASIANSYATGAVSGAGLSGSIGGLVGFNNALSQITNSHATGNVSATAIPPNPCSNNCQNTDVGGLIGSNYGAVSGSYASGAVTAVGSNSVTNNSYAGVGGLVGINTTYEYNGAPIGVASIANSYANGNVTVSGVNVQVGGLVGQNNAASTITGSQATGNVGATGTTLGETACSNDCPYVNAGGLVGFNNGGSVSGDSATGAVTVGSAGVIGGISNAGGLVAQNSGAVSGSSATGAVTGASYANLGGLVGSSGACCDSSGNPIAGASITGSYAEGAVGSAGVNVELGGLVGNNGPLSPITDSYATGNVSATGTLPNSSNCSNGCPYINAGGLAGSNSSAISGSYATGAVGAVGSNPLTGSSSYTAVGGLVGQNGNFDSNGNQIAGASIVNSYANGAVTSASLDANIGGLVGFNGLLSPITNSHAIGNVSATGVAASENNCSNDCPYVDVGGLAGVNGGAMSGSYASGIVTAAGPNSVTNNSYTAAGGLVGQNGVYENGAPVPGTTITNSFATGAVNVAGVNVNVGGLVGQNFSLAMITGSYATGNVSATGTTLTAATCSTNCPWINVGGGVGQNDGGLSAETYATGAVTVGTTGITGDFAVAGGLVGYSDGAVSGSFASGAVSGGSYSNLGGLAGGNTGTITSSYVTMGSVTASGDYISAGGLVGYNDGGVSQSYANGAGSSAGAHISIGGLVGYNDVDGTVATSQTSYAVTAGSDHTTAGGLVGNNYGGVSGSFANDAVSSAGVYVSVGGLVGDNEAGATIANAQAYGSVTEGGHNVSEGGLAGDNYGTISLSNAHGAVSGAGENISIGGLVGFNRPAGTVANSQAYGDVASTANLSSNATCTTDCPSVNVGGFAGQNLGTISGATWTTPPTLPVNCGAGDACASGNVSVGQLGTAGGFVGVNGGFISYAFATGDVTGAAGLPGNANTATGLGGFVFVNQGQIADAFATGSVGEAGVDYLKAGGFALRNGGTIDSSFATGAVQTGDYSFAGGFVGNNSPNACSSNCGDGYDSSAAITNSQAYGSVTAGAASFVGGFAAYSPGDFVGIGGAGGSFTNITAYGAVTAGADSVVGGLIGALGVGSTISNSSAQNTLVASTGANSIVGGIAGISDGSISNSTSSAPVSGTSDSFIGGLVGANLGVVSQSSVVATVTGSGGGNFIGGVAGLNAGTITGGSAQVTLASGDPSNYVGGVAGVNGVYINETATFANSSFPSGTIVSLTATGSGFSDQVGTTLPGSTPTAPSVLSNPACTDPACAILAGGILAGQQIIGYVYINGDPVGSGVIVSGLVNGASFGTATTAADGSYDFLLAANTIPASSAQVLTYTTGANAGAAYQQNAPGTIFDLNIFSGFLSEITGSNALSAVSAGLSTAIGGNTTVKAIVSGLPNLAISATAASFNIDQPIAMTGALVLDADGAIGATAAVNVGAFTLAYGNWTQLGGPLPSFAAQNFSIIGGSFLRALGGTGSAESPYQIADVYGLQGIGSSPALLADNYALANAIDASGTANWNGGAGFAPIGSYATSFSGAFDGQGNTINNLVISSTLSPAGLFAVIGAGGMVSNLNVTNTSLNAGTNIVAGVVAGENDGTINNAFVSGAIVSGSGNNPAQLTPIGGLVGLNTGAISNASAAATITAGLYTYAGGLVGQNLASGTINQSSASGTISGAGNTQQVTQLGGLVANSAGTINYSSASTTIVGGTSTDAAGLVAANEGSIANSDATGGVTGGDSSRVGGLVSSNGGAITLSWASGDVTGGANSDIGGLAGRNETTGSGPAVPGTITSSYATGAVGATGTSTSVGGLVGYNPVGATISDSYATGAVTLASNLASDSYSNAGGLVGDNAGAISGSYASGAVNGGSNSNLGGLVGYSGHSSNGNPIVGASISNSYAEGMVSTAGVNVEIGGLVGFNSALSPITNSYATGNVSATATLPNQSDFEFVNIGGLAGQNSGSISGSYATGAVAAAGSIVGRANSYTDAGGLVGYNEGAVSGSYATGAVTVGTHSSAGGLVAENGVSDSNSNPIGGASVTNSYATGAVSSLGVDVILGGLVGENDPLSLITNSYATGNVSATGTIASQDCSGNGVCDYLTAGGLVGQSYGTISGPNWTTPPTLATAPTTCVAGYTCASGSVTVGSLGDGGGLVGFNNGIIANAFAIANVTGAPGLPIAIGSAGSNLTRLGGLAADNMGQITDAFALGAVGSPSTANLSAGGLVAKNFGLITGSFANVTVSTGDNSVAGGLAAINLLADSASCYQCYTGYSENLTETINNSNAYGSVTVGASSIAGGLVGESDLLDASIPGGGSIANSSAFGAVAAGGDSMVGGLAGGSNSTISASSAGNTLVSSSGANSIVGGLVGFNAGSVTTSSSTAPVSGADDSYVGGLIGFNIGSVTQSTVDPPITAGAGSFVGGVAGLNLGSIGGVTAQAAITSGAGAVVGGVAGVNGAYPELAAGISGSSYPTGTITDSNASGTGFSSQVEATSPSSSPAFPSWLIGCKGPICEVLADVQAAQAASTPGVVTYLIADSSSTYGTIPTPGLVTLIGAPSGLTATVEVLSGSTPITLAANTPAGVYTEIVTMLSDPSYTIATSGNRNGILTIDPATLTYVASATTRTYGAGNPTLGGTVTGFVAGDTLASATTGALAFSTAATPGSNVGNYAITGSGLTANNGNYVFAQASANATALTVTPAPVTVTALGGASVYGSSPANPGLSATGLQNGQNVSALTGLTNSFGINSASTVAGSPYLLSVAGTLSNPNYFVTATNDGVWIVGSPQTLTPVPPGTLNLIANPAAPAVSNNQAKEGGCATPGFGFNSTGGDAPVQVARDASWRSILNEVARAAELQESIGAADFGEAGKRREMAFPEADEATALERRIGSAVIAQNKVDELNGSTTKTITVGDDVFGDETVRTGEDSTGKFVFLDDTNLSMGPKATVKLDRFVFSGESTYSEAAINLTVGTFRFITGNSAKKAYAINTPVATVGVRGTIVDIKIEKGGATKVALVEGGAVVCPRGNAKGCAVLKPGQTANVGFTKAAIRPTQWTFASTCVGNGSLCGQTTVASAATTIAAQRLALQSGGGPCAP